MFNNSFSACAFFFLFLVFFFLSFLYKVEISSHTLIPLFGQDQSTVAQRAETTVTECSLTSCVSSRFLIGSHTMPGLQHSHSDFVGSRLYACLVVACHLHF